MILKKRNIRDMFLGKFHFSENFDVPSFSFCSASCLVNSKKNKLAISAWDALSRSVDVAYLFFDISFMRAYRQTNSTFPLISFFRRRSSEMVSPDVKHDLKLLFFIRISLGLVFNVSRIVKPPKTHFAAPRVEKLNCPFSSDTTSVMSFVGIKISRISDSVSPNSVQLRRLNSFSVASRPNLFSNVSNFCSIVLMCTGKDKKIRLNYFHVKFNLFHVIRE